MIGEPQLGDYFGTKHAGDVRSCGDAATGRDLFGDATSTNNVAAFQHESRKSGFCQVCGSGKAIVAGADDNGIVG